MEQNTLQAEILKETIKFLEETLQKSKLLLSEIENKKEFQQELTEKINDISKSVSNIEKVIV